MSLPEAGSGASKTSRAPQFEQNRALAVSVGIDFPQVGQNIVNLRSPYFAILGIGPLHCDTAEALVRFPG
jgi:hypothetical protein